MHTWIICSTKWIRLEKPACEDLGRIANRFDGFRLLTVDSVLVRHHVDIRVNRVDVRLHILCVRFFKQENKRTNLEEIRLHKGLFVQWLVS